MNNPVQQVNEPNDLTVVVHRRIKPGQEAEFEEAMKRFVNFALGFPGHRGINVIRPATGEHDYIVVDKFADQATRDSFTATAQYKEWMERLGQHTEGSPTIQQLSGLEGWFSRPGQPLQTPPSYKMALVTFIGVCIVIAFLNLVLTPFIKNWAYFPNLLIFNAFVVSLLTWVVMPVLTKILHRWLFKKQGDRVSPNQ